MGLFAASRLVAVCLVTILYCTDLCRSSQVEPGWLGWLSTQSNQESAAEQNHTEISREQLLEFKRKLEALKDKYTAAVEQAHGIRTSGRAKRDIQELSTDNKGVYKLRGVSPMSTVPAQTPFDIELFHFKSDLYALVADHSRPQGKSASVMNKYDKSTGKFVKVLDLPVRYAVDWASFVIENDQYIVAAEYLSTEDPDNQNPGHPGSILYKFDTIKNSLTYVQTLQTFYATAIEPWMDENMVMCLAIANSMIKDEEGKIKFEVPSVVYRWEGAHFDQFATITTYNAQSLIPFRIHDHVFLAVANRQNDAGQYSIDSEIFIYNLDRQDFESFQKIRTHGAKDWEFFSFGEGNEQEFFIVVANEFEEHNNVRNYHVDSVIYKFAGSHFVPFQCIPTHGAQQWLAIRGSDDQFLLAVANYYSGVALYAYNGWRFVETPVQYTSDAMGPSVVSLSWTLHEDSIILAACDETQQFSSLSPNIFRLEWVYSNELAEFHKKTEEWCRSRREQIQEKDVDGLLQAVNGAFKINQERIQINGNLHLPADTWMQRLQTSKITDLSTGITYDHSLLFKLWEMYQRLQKVVDGLGRISALLKRALKTTGDQTVTAPYKFDSVGFYGGAEVNAVEVEMLNNENVIDLPNNVVYLDQPHKFDVPFTFVDGIHVTSSLNVDGLIDGVRMDELVTLSGDHAIQAHKTIVGDVKAPSLRVAGTVDGVDVSPDTLFLTVGNQNITGSFTFADISVPSLSIGGRLNNVDLSWLFAETVLLDTDSTITGKKTFVGPVTVEGDIIATDGATVNGIDIVELDRKAMRVDRNQVITGRHQYGPIQIQTDLHVIGLVNGVSIPSERAMLLDGTYTVTGRKVFTEDVTIDTLEVERSINGVQVLPGGTLDLLLLDGDQVITGRKTFQSLTLYGDSPVEGLVDGVDLKDLLDNSLTVHGDQNINGHLALHGDFAVEHLTLGGLLDGVDLDRLFGRGLRLTDQIIPASLTMLFSELRAEDLKVLTINGVDIEDLWFRSRPAIITGHKIFQDTIILEAPMTVLGQINDVDLHKLANDTLFVDGNQVITGSKRLTAPVTFADGVHVKGLLDGIDLRDAVRLDEEAVFTGTNTFKEIEVRDLRAGQMTVGGTVNQINLNELAENTLFQSGDQVVAGKKHVDRMIVDSLDVSGFIDDIDFAALVRDAVYVNRDNVITAPKKFRGRMLVNELNFENTLDGVTDYELKHGWMMNGVDQEVKGDVTFSNDVVAKHLDARGRINDLDIAELAAEAVHLDEAADLKGPYHFSQVLSEGHVNVAGYVDGYKLADEAISVDQKVVITGKKYFEGSVDIRGDLLVEGTLDGVDVSDLCDTAVRRDADQYIQSLNVKGDATLDDDLEVKGLVNGIDLPQFDRDVMKTNQDQVVTGRKTLLGGASFQNMKVGGLVDTVDVEDIAASYMSLTRDQVVTGNIEFKKLKVEGDLSGNSLTIADEHLLNGIDIEDFSKSVLLDYGDQHVNGSVVFKGPVKIAGSLTVYGLVDGIVIPDDIVIIGTDNVITGYKEFTRPLHIQGNLDMSPGTTVQGLDVSEWAKSVVYKDEDTTIIGPVSFNNIDLQQVTAEGLFDGVKVSAEELMVQELPQTVTGLKTFGGIEIDDDLRVGGLIDGVDLEQLFSTAVKMDQDNVIQKDIQFAVPPALTEATTLARVDGVIIRDLLKDLSVSFPTDELENITGQLGDRASQIVSALSRQAVMLGYYENYQFFQQEGILWYSFTLPSGDNMLALITRDCDSKCSPIHLYIWDMSQEKYLPYQVLVSSKTVGIASLTSGRFLVLADSDSFVECSQTTSSLRGRLNSYDQGALQVFQWDDQSSAYVYLYTVPVGTASDIKTISMLDMECVLVAVERDGQSTHCQSPVFCMDVVTGRLQPVTSVGSAKAKQVDVVAHPLTSDLYTAVANSEAWLDVYMMEGTEFIRIQAISGVDFRKVCLIADEETVYLMTVSRHEQTAVQVFKHDLNLGKFSLIETLDHKEVLDVAMALLPTDNLELTAFVLDDCNARPNLFIYTLEGATGFRLRLKIKAAGATSLTPFKHGAWYDYQLYLALTGRSTEDAMASAPSRILKLVVNGKRPHPVKLTTQG